MRTEQTPAAVDGYRGTAYVDVDRYSRDNPPSATVYITIPFFDQDAAETFLADLNVAHAATFDPDEVGTCCSHPRSEHFEAVPDGDPEHCMGCYGSDDPTEADWSIHAFEGGAQ